MSEAARSRRVEPGFEPPTERPVAPRAGSADPLAELARLVGQDDPFRNMFKPAVPPVRPMAHEPTGDVPQEAAWNDPDTAAAVHHDTALNAAAAHEADDWAAPNVLDEHYVDSAYHEDGADHAQHDEPTQDHGAEDEHQAYEAPVHAPDLWAEPSPVKLADESAVLPPTPRRPLLVLFAVLILTGGGLGATFLARTGSSIAATNGANAPVILASTAPDKIKQADTSSTTNAEDADAALLDRNGDTHGGPVKVINSQEQPIDLAQLPKAEMAPGAAADAPLQSSQSPFPEPRKVKTFLVRPNGTMIPTSEANELAPQGLNGLPQMATLPSTAPLDGAGMPVAPMPATPQTNTRAATTPKAAPPASGDPAGDATDSVPAKARQAAAPTPRPKPVKIADAAASDSAATPQSSGGFALQLAASPSERDAREAFVRLQKKYTELGSYQPRIKKAGSADKPVYRLRVGSLSQDQAKTLCAQLQASGGSCFVVRN